MRRIESVNMHINPEVVVSQYDEVVDICLNKPKVLNALDEQMMLCIQNAIENHPNHCIMIRSSNTRALCAGGDMKSIYYGASVPGLFQKFYKSSYCLRKNVRNSLAVMQGITMGAGAALSNCCRIRIATNSTKWAMPEVALGYFPDIGASYFLNKIPIKGLGLYLALTGDTLNGADCYFARLATHYVEESLVQDLEEDLCDFGVWDQIINYYHSEPDISQVKVLRHIDHISKVFGNAQSVDQIVERLLKMKCGKCYSVLERINHVCPLSVKIGFVSMKLGKQMKLAQVLNMEYHLTRMMLMQHNETFQVGAQAVLIDKIKTRANWNPKSLEEVTDDDILPFFAGFGQDKLGLGQKIVARL